MTSLTEKVRSKSRKKPFRWNEFKKLNNLDDMYKYANSRLRFIGAGLDRQVFVLTSGTVLKIANDYGEALSQNASEVAVSTRKNVPPVVVKVLDFHPEFYWIVSELVRPLTEKEQEDYYREILDLEDIANTHYGIDDIHDENVGFAPDGRLVILDTGISEEYERRDESLLRNTIKHFL